MSKLQLFKQITKHRLFSCFLLTVILYSCYPTEEEIYAYRHFDDCISQPVSYLAKFRKAMIKKSIKDFGGIEKYSIVYDSIKLRENFWKKYHNIFLNSVSVKGEKGMNFFTDSILILNKNKTRLIAVLYTTNKFKSWYREYKGIVDEVIPETFDRHEGLYYKKNGRWILLNERWVAMPKLGKRDINPTIWQAKMIVTDWFFLPSMDEESSDLNHFSKLKYSSGIFYPVPCCGYKSDDDI